MARLVSRRTTHVLLVLLALFLIGTVVFLSAVNAYFSIDKSAIIRPEELGTWEQIAYGGDESTLSWKTRYPWLAEALSLKPTGTTTLTKDQEVRFDDAIAKHAAEAAKAAGFGDDRIFIPSGRDNSVKEWNPTTDPPEKIPRIIHQTWKDRTLPPNWKAVRDECEKMHPDYQYMLWTDADSRQFLVDHYPWFVNTFDAYPFPIQRADAIRYFILHKFGGIYMDLDVGCLRRFDPLLRFEVILPKTIPVGVSNDVMAAAKGHPFMDHLIHNLVTFNHRYLTHYPTVMFSTGPMFVSASYGLYVDAHGLAIPSTPSNPSAGFTGIRVLPKPLYGKNAKPSEAPDAFFRHFYGSSWHANDADFLIFLRDHGRILIFVGFCIAIYGLGRSVLPRLFTMVGERSDRRSRGSRRGRWISLPFIRDPRSGRFHSVIGDSSMRRSKTLSDESTQTGHSPTTAVAAAENLAGSRRGEEGGAASAFSSTTVAAPRPQRVNMPMFQLREGEAATMNEDEEELDLGPGLNAERLDKGSSPGILHRMWDGFSSSSSRPSSVDASDYPGSGVADLMRSGSASKYKGKGNGVFYLPAYFVGGGSSTSGSSTTDSVMTMNRINEEDSLLSPRQGGSSSSSTPTWSITQPHARNASGTANGGFSNWAASFLPNGAVNTMREASPTLQKMFNGVGGLSGRTPSPNAHFTSRSFSHHSTSAFRLVDDLENSVKTGEEAAVPAAAAGLSPDSGATSSIAMSRNPSREVGGGGRLSRASSLRQSIDADHPPPPPYEDDQGGKDEKTPTMGARRFLGRRE